MRKTITAASLPLLLLATGCKLSSTLFDVFGDHYTDGGYTREEKEYHYNKQLEASRSYSDWDR